MADLVNQVSSSLRSLQTQVNASTAAIAAAPSGNNNWTGVNTFSGLTITAPQTVNYFTGSSNTITIAPSTSLIYVNTGTGNFGTTAGAQCTLFLNLGDGLYDGQRLTVVWVSDLSIVNGGTSSAVGYINIQGRQFTGVVPQGVYNFIAYMNGAAYWIPPGQGVTVQNQFYSSTSFQWSSIYGWSPVGFEQPFVPS